MRHSELLLHLVKRARETICDSICLLASHIDLVIVSEMYKKIVAFLV
jgi:hypothetical protein